VIVSDSGSHRLEPTVHQNISTDNRVPPSNRNTPLKVDILLPVKERFTPKNAGAISGVVRDLVMASRSGTQFTIFGHPVERPFDDVAFTGLAPRRRWLHGRNIGFAASYLDSLQNRLTPDLVEVHSRGQVAAYLLKKRPDLRVLLYFHNDPREMLGTQTAAERTALLARLAGVICVSDYIRSCYLDGLDIDQKTAAKVGVARNGAVRWLNEQPKKDPIILLAGRMVPEKGILECTQALAKLLPDFPDWRLIIAGARRFEDARPGSYEAKIAEVIKPLGNQASMLGFIPLEEVRQWQARAAISACPSIWHDPMPKAVLESLAAGCALLTTRRGGIPEAAEGRAHILDDVSINGFLAGFRQLLNDDDYRQRLQDSAWLDFPFTDDVMAKMADQCRQKAVDSALS